MSAWPADHVERRPLDQLIPYVRNARTHSEQQVAQIAGSIREFGFAMPVLIDENNVLIAGHGRVLAAQSLGLTEVPCMTARDWTDAQIRAYRLADNKMALNAGWDDELLSLELMDLKAGDYDLTSVGFSEIEIKRLLASGLGAGGDASLDPPASAWAVIVECTDETDQVALIESLQAEGRKVKASIG